MKRILFGAAKERLACCWARPRARRPIRTPAVHYVSGVVPIQPGVGPLFTNTNPGKISGSFTANLTGFPADASLFAALRRS